MQEEGAWFCLNNGMPDFVDSPMETLFYEELKGNKGKEGMEKRRKGNLDWYAKLKKYFNKKFSGKLLIKTWTHGLTCKGCIASLILPFHENILEAQNISPLEGTCDLSCSAAQQKQ